MAEGHSIHDDRRDVHRSGNLSRISTDATSSDNQWYVGFVAALIPVVAVAALDPQGWFPFSVAKWAAVLVVSLLAVAVALLIGDEATTSSRRERWSTGALGVTVVITLVSAATGLDGLYAWIGTPIRHLGALTWIVFLAVFVLGERIGHSDRGSRTVARGAVVAGTLMGVYTMVEALFAAPVEYLSGSSRLGGPFGSAAYLGAAACLLLPVGVGMARSDQEARPWRWLATATSMMLTVALLGSGSRAAIVGLLVAMAVIAVARRGAWHAATGSARPRSNQRRLVTAAALSVGAIAGLLLAVSAGVFERSAGWASRLDEWRLALQSIAEHPVSGVGPEGYRLVVGHYVDAEYTVRYGETVGIDRAHSGVLDVAVVSGLLAALVYLAALGLVCWAAFLLARRGRRLDAGLSAAVIAYAAQQQLLFPIAELDPTFWLLAGVVVARSCPAARREAPPRAHSVPAGARRATGCVLLVLVVVSAVVGVRSVAADRVARDAARANQSEVAVADAGHAVSLAPHDIRLRLLLARSEERVHTLSAVDRALVAVGDALHISQRDPTARRERARLLGLRASITGSDIDRRRAAAAWDDLIREAPACAQCHLGAGLAAAERGDPDTARRELTIASALGNEMATTALDQI